MERKIFDAHYLAQDGGIYGRGWSPAPASGWWYDGRGAKPLERNYAPYSISNVSGEAPTGMVRELRKTNEGVVTVQANVVIKDGFDGLFIRLYDNDKNDAACIYTKDGAYVALGKNQKEFVLKKEQKKQRDHHFKIILDFEAKCVSYIIDNDFCGKLPLTAKYIKYYKIGTFAGNIIDVEMGQTHIHANYILNDSFSLHPGGNIPYGWESNCGDDASAEVVGGNLVLKSQHMTEASVAHSFAPQNGKFCYESFFFMPKIKDGAKFAFKAGKKTALEFFTQDGNFCAAGLQLRYALDELWYRLRFEFDVAKKNVLIKVNGKNVQTVKLSSGSTAIDRVEISLCSENAELRTDIIRIFPLIDYPDYCPKPKLPKGKDDYVIGMNMCSLWHTGEHVGWDCISPYPEIKPVIGYYDEGLPEVADWEIKFMLEHGIDFQLYCWYASQSNAPIKATGLSGAIHDGYFNCKYSEMSRFALLWEAANAAHPAGSEPFRRYFVPYWIEHFFSDKRYMTINNKAIMAVFGPGQLIKDFGGAENVKKELDYLKSEVKKLGYDDLIIMGCGSASKEMRDCGFDAAYAYNWDKRGNDAGYTVDAIRAMQNLGYVHFVPTASTGFNNVAWAETRSPNMSAEDFKKLHTVFRDEMLPEFSDKPDWAQKFIMMSNWNEYGEGTYIMPCKGLNGFGYLDAVRDVYTREKGEHTDDVPTPSQLSRLSYLYPQERKMLRTQNKAPALVPDKLIKSVNFGKGNIDDLWEKIDVDATLTNGTLSGVTHSVDPQLIMKTECKIKMGGATHVRLRAKVSKRLRAEIFYLVEGQETWTQAQAMQFNFEPGQEFSMCNITKLPNLDKTITALRVDPGESLDIAFEFYGFDIMKDTNNPEFFVNGERQPINSPIVVKGSYTLMPFNPYHVLVYKLGLYYEYIDAKKELAFYSKDASVVFTIGSRNVVINGEKKLLESPIELYDGLPMLPLEVMSGVLGFKFTYKKPRLDIKTK